MDPFFLLFIAFVLLWWKVEESSPEKVEKLDKFARENIKIIFDNTNLLQQQNNAQDEHHNHLRQIVQNIKDEDVKILDLVRQIGEELAITDKRSKTAFMADLKMIHYFLTTLEQTGSVKLPEPKEDRMRTILSVYLTINPDAKGILDIVESKSAEENLQNHP